MDGFSRMGVTKEFVNFKIYWKKLYNQKNRGKEFLKRMKENEKTNHTLEGDICKRHIWKMTISQTLQRTHTTHNKKNFKN